MFSRWFYGVLFCTLPFAKLVDGNRWPKESNPSVRFEGIQLYVDDKPYYIQGVCYSPVPIGESPVFEEPFGDYFTDDYAYMWKRDFPIIKAMGANTIRIYGWNVAADHFGFLNMVASYGLRVMTTFYAGTTNEWSHYTPEIRQSLIVNWTREVNKYGDHPAILMWSFGNELNGPWNGLVPDLSTENNCKYTELGCFNKPHPDPDCINATRCMYQGLYGFINDAIKAGRRYSSRPVASGFADIDYTVTAHDSVSKVFLMSDLIPEMDAWAMQLYRGQSFGAYFSQFSQNSAKFPKPLLITEYGVDAFNDPCGWPETMGENICFNVVGDPKGGVYPDNGTFIGCADSHASCAIPGATAQANWDRDLTQEIIDNYPNIDSDQTITNPTCIGPWEHYPQCQETMNWLAQNWQKNPVYKEAGVDGTPCSLQKYIFNEDGKCPDPYHPPTGPCIGGFLMEWQDGSWKGFATQAMCSNPCNPREIEKCKNGSLSKYQMGGSAGCGWKAHFTCKNLDSTYHGLCGYRLWSAPDYYVNEEWFGITEPESCGVDDGNDGHKLDRTKTIRDVFYKIRALWKPDATDTPVLQTCEELLPCYRCLQSHNLTYCHRLCDYTIPAPTHAPPPTSSPTTGSPTSFPTSGPTSGPTSSPTSSPTSGPTFPSISPDVPTETGSSSDAVHTKSPAQSPTRWMRVIIMMRYNLPRRLVSENKTFEKELKQDFVDQFGVSSDRIHVISVKEDSEDIDKSYVYILVDQAIGGNGPSSWSIYEEIATLVKNKSDALKKGKTSKYIDYQFLPQQRENVPDTPIPKTHPKLGTTGLVAVIVILLGVVILCGVAFHRYQKSRYQMQGKFASLIEDDVDYVPPCIPESDSGGLIQNVR